MSLVSLSSTLLHPKKVRGDLPHSWPGQGFREKGRLKKACVTGGGTGRGGWGSQAQGQSVQGACCPAQGGDLECQSWREL